MTDPALSLIRELGVRVADLETRTQECHRTLESQQDSLRSLALVVEQNQDLFLKTLDATEKNGVEAYREVVQELRQELATRMRWILMAVAIGAAIAGGTNLLPTLGQLP